MTEHSGLFTKIDGQLVSIRVDENENVEDIYNNLSDTAKIFIKKMPESKKNEKNVGWERMSQFLNDCCCETGLRRAERQEETE